MRFSVTFFLIIASLIGTGQLYAHHGNAAYDATKTVVQKATVTEWWWANPHCLLMYDVKDNGQVVHWISETQAPINMIPAGWSKESFKPGDQVTVMIAPAKTGKPIGRIEAVVLPNGKKLVGQTQEHLLEKDAQEGHAK